MSALTALRRQSQHRIGTHWQTKHIVGWNSVALVAVRSLNPLELIIRPADFTYSAIGTRINVGDISVLTMKISGELDVVCVTVIMKRFLVHRHVSVMQESGINMLRIILIIPIMELEDSSKDLGKIYLGNKLLISIYNHMMNLLLRHAEKIIFLHLVSIV